WAVEQAIETGVSAPVITLSLMRRFRSREKESFSDKVVAALRREFGGHSVQTAVLPRRIILNTLLRRIRQRKYSKQMEGELFTVVEV
ncbi:MAG: hypothetical protein OQJ93_11910, partial [Ignavibacteriaceae bacterium]|nr:hypothetical protein [Ignavibacteriaceae bacterium]